MPIIVIWPCVTVKAIDSCDGKYCKGVLQSVMILLDKWKDKDTDK